VKTKAKSKAAGEVETAKPAPATGVAPIPSESSVDATANRKTFAVYVDANGKIEVDRLQERTKAQLRSLFQDSSLPGKLGIASAAVPAPQFVSTEMVSAFYDTLGNIESLIGQKVFKVSSDIASKAFTFDAEKKKSLTPLTVKVANKYAWEWLQKYGDEIMLLSVFVGVTLSQVAVLKTLQAGGKVSEKSIAYSAPTPEAKTVEVAPVPAKGANGSVATSAKTESTDSVEIALEETERVQ